MSALLLPRGNRTGSPRRLPFVIHVANKLRDSFATRSGRSCHSGKPFRRPTVPEHQPQASDGADVTAALTRTSISRRSLLAAASVSVASAALAGCTTTGGGGRPGRPPAEPPAAMAPPVAAVPPAAAVEPRAEAPAAAETPVSAAVAADSDGIELEVSLDPALAARVPGPTPVFIIARNAAGGPPLAVIRSSTTELPKSVRLTDANAMMEGVTFLDQDELELVARVSLSGSPAQRPGDLYGAVNYRRGNGGTARIRIDRIAE